MLSSLTNTPDGFESVIRNALPVHPKLGSQAIFEQWDPSRLPVAVSTLREMLHPFLMCLGTELVANASDAIVRSGRSDGRIELSVALGDRVRVLVEDNGIGLTPDTEALVFQKVERKDEPASVQLPGIAGGKGIGLELLAESVNRCGGIVGFANKGLGNGAVFWFDVPSLALKRSYFRS